MEMTSVVVLHGHHLCQVYRRLRNVAVLQGLLATVLLPVVLLTPRMVPATVMLVLILGCYVLLKTHLTIKHGRVLKQLRLEERFLREVPRGDGLKAWLSMENHLWSSSRLWLGLRSVLMQPLPHLLLVDEKRRRIERHYHRAIRDLQPRRINMHVFFALAAVFLWEASYLLVGAENIAFSLAGALFAGLLMLEAMQTGVQWSAAYQFESLEKALCAWTLANRFEQGMTPKGKGYTHRLLYQARPWFVAPGARKVTSTVRAPGDLREVA